MILTTYKYIVKGNLKSPVFNMKNDDFIESLSLLKVSFSFNYFSLTKLFLGTYFAISNRNIPVQHLKIKVK